MKQVKLMMMTLTICLVSTVSFAQTYEALKYTWQSTKKNMVCVHEGCGKSYVIRVPTKIVSFEDGTLEDMTLDMIFNSFPPVSAGLKNLAKRCNNLNFRKCLFENKLPPNASNHVASRTKAQVETNRLATLVFPSNERGACELIAMPCVTKFLKDNPKIRMAFETEVKENKLREDERLKAEEEAREAEQARLKAEQARLQEEERARKKAELEAEMRAQEDAKRKLEEYKNSELSKSESLMVGTWNLTGKTKDDKIGDYIIDINFTKEKRNFTMVIDISTWSVQTTNVYGVQVKTKDKKEWNQKLTFTGTWGKIDNSTIKLIYDNYENTGGSLNDASVKSLVGIIDESMDVINIRTYKGKKITVKFGDVEMKGKRSGY